MKQFHCRFGNIAADFGQLIGIGQVNNQRIIRRSALDLEYLANRIFDQGVNRLRRESDNFTVAQRFRGARQFFIDIVVGRANRFSDHSPASTAFSCAAACKPRTNGSRLPASVSSS